MHMKRNLLAILIGALVASPALGRAGLKPNQIQKGLTYSQAAAQSTKTRAEVKQELRAHGTRTAKMERSRLGLVPKSEQIGAKDTHKSRAEVRAALDKAYQQGKLNPPNAEIGWRTHL